MNVSAYRWSSDREADRFDIHDPSTAEVIAVIQGGGLDQVDGAVQARRLPRGRRPCTTSW